MSERSSTLPGVTPCDGPCHCCIKTPEQEAHLESFSWREEAQKMRFPHTCSVCGGPCLDLFTSHECPKCDAPEPVEPEVVYEEAWFSPCKTTWLNPDGAPEGSERGWLARYLAHGPSGGWAPTKEEALKLLWERAPTRTAQEQRMADFITRSIAERMRYSEATRGVTKEDLVAAVMGVESVQDVELVEPSPGNALLKVKADVTDGWPNRRLDVFTRIKDAVRGKIPLWATAEVELNGKWGRL